jgi:hypothetical protein
MGSSGTILEAILTQAENVRAALQKLEPHGRNARQLLTLHSGHAVETRNHGRHAQLLRFS